MMRIDDLRGLQARVEEAKEGSPDLDEALHAVLMPDDPWWQSIMEGRRLVAAGDPEAYVICPPTGPLGGENRMRAISWAEGAKIGGYTTSIDSAVGLIAKTLPGWSLHLGMSEGLRHPNVVMGRSHPTNKRVAVEHRTAPLALIAALLSALIAQEVEHGR